MFAQTSIRTTNLSYDHATTVIGCNWPPSITHAQGPLAAPPPAAYGRLLKAFGEVVANASVAMRLASRAAARPRLPAGERVEAAWVPPPLTWLALTPPPPRPHLKARSPRRRRNLRIRRRSTRPARWPS
jgi:hypothetical protein